MYVKNNISTSTPLYRSLPHGMYLISYLYETNKKGEDIYIENEEIYMAMITKSSLFQRKNLFHHGLIINQEGELVCSLRDYVEIYISEKESVFAIFNQTQKEEEERTVTSFVLTKETLHTKCFSVNYGDIIKFYPNEPKVQINDEQYSLLSE